MHFAKSVCIEFDWSLTLWFWKCVQNPNSVPAVGLASHKDICMTDPISRYCFVIDTYGKLIILASATFTNLFIGRVFVHTMQKEQYMSFIGCQPFGPVLSLQLTQYWPTKPPELEIVRESIIWNMIYNILSAAPSTCGFRVPKVRIRGHLGSIVGDSVTSRLETRGTSCISIVKLASFRIQALLDRVQLNDNKRTGGLAVA